MHINAALSASVSEMYVFSLCYFSALVLFSVIIAKCLYNWLGVTGWKGILPVEVLLQ